MAPVNFPSDYYSNNSVPHQTTEQEVDPVVTTKPSLLPDHHEQQSHQEEKKVAIMEPTATTQQTEKSGTTFDDDGVLKDTTPSKDTTAEVTEHTSIGSSLEDGGRSVSGGSNHSRKIAVAGYQDDKKSSETDHYQQDDKSPTNNTNPLYNNLNDFIQEGESNILEGPVGSKNNGYTLVAPMNVEEDMELAKTTTDPSAGAAARRSGPVTITRIPTVSSGGVKCPKKKRGVRFDQVEIREYDITIGQSPYCSYGVPITLDWSHGENQSMSLDQFEKSHKRKRTARRMLLTSFQRRDMLWRAGYELEEIEKAIKENDRDKFRRGVTLYFLPFFQLQELVMFSFQKAVKKGSSTQQEQNAVVEAVLKQQEQELESRSQQSDTEIGGMSIVEQDSQERRQPPQRRLSFRSSSSPAAQASSHQEEEPVDMSIRSSSLSESSHDRDDPYAASSNSRFKAYSIRVDRGQHDKATEIILCDLQRPHMRAFHASWFSFFIAFFTWFAVTPLLGEIKDTLELSKADIWTSSLCGTAGTIIMRIVLGPMCDKFGARICMAFILAISAVPCAFTGFVNTSQGLSTVRSFIGIAGSAFVACQYWTSQMFTREVAGTANALVAGWGNLGGGVTQVIMGSALFPLFELMYSADNEDGPIAGMSSDELAWRTVFVVPSLVSLITAYVVVYHCDDSPKGDYRERVLQQQISVVSPAASLCIVCENWNVWILLFQYACCFGVEVTMTNASALYFKEEFGQSTVSAAAIASVFGFMNLFARGLGGFGSDLFNAKYGMRGRIAWQSLTLFLEGAFIVVFGFADTLAWSIIALILLSCMVQSAEGSTFGIVPYVDRRFTGSVVGWVGAGGNVGGVIFAVFFREYSYKTAFVLMGMAASASAFLSFFLNIKKFSRIQQWEMHEVGITKETAIVFPNSDRHQDGKQQ